MPSPSSDAGSRRNKILLAVLGGFGLLLFCTCASCILFVSQRDRAERERDAVGSAAEILTLRSELDRIVDTFPASPTHGPCTEPPPAERVVVLRLGELAVFRSGDGYADSQAGELDLTSTNLHGFNRPADTITDEEAFDQLDQLVSPLRTISRSSWIAVVRTNDIAMPAVTFDTFIPGRFEGDVVVFERVSGRVLCAQPLSATNSPTVDVSTFQAGSDAARADLRNQLDAAKDSAAAALGPTLSFDW